MDAGVDAGVDADVAADAGAAAVCAIATGRARAMIAATKILSVFRKRPDII
jgi:hypothetical protein